jgi:hypothetical protein
LSFEHPVTGRALELSAPISADMLALWQRLSREPSAADAGD